MSNAVSWKVKRIYIDMILSPPYTTRNRWTIDDRNDVRSRFIFLAITTISGVLMAKEDGGHPPFYLLGVV